MTVATLPGLPQLSPADRALVELVAAGEPDKRIATLTGRSRTAVTRRVRELMAETGTLTRAHLVAVVLHGAPVEPPLADSAAQVAQRRAALIADLNAWEAKQGIGYYPARRPQALRSAA